VKYIIKLSKASFESELQHLAPIILVFAVHKEIGSRPNFPLYYAAILGRLFK
jgi:hypothetical protein